MKGRIPKPTKLKVLSGNPGKRKLNESEPIPPAEPIHCPDWLSPAARKEWDRLLPLLEKAGLATSLDSGVLAEYCQTLCVYEKATRDVQKHGLTYVAESGLVKTRPSVRIQMDAAKLLSNLSDRIGMNPAARSRVQVQAQPKKTKLQEFLERNKGGNKAS